MATGIQTGMRTGSAPVPTGTRGTAPAGGGSPVQKILQSLNGMSPKQKLIGGIVIGLLLVVAIAFSMYSKSTQFVSLYDTPLTETDVKQITDRLTQLGIEYRTGEGAKEILVSPSVRNRAKMQLAQYGLPLRKLKIPENSTINTKTLEQQKVENRQILEADLTESVRQIDGVADAYVKIVTPKEDIFESNQKPTTASVMVRLTPGTQLSASQVKGLVHLIAFSVEGLEPKNVKVVDTQGIILTTDEIIGEDGNPNVLTTLQNEKKIALEQDLQRKVQKLLDDSYGPNRTRVAVNATLDFSTKTTESKQVGGVGNTSGEVATKIKTSEEIYNTGDSNKDGDVAQMGTFKGSSDPNVGYVKKDSVIIKDTNTVITKRTTPAGGIQRLTASVVVDNFKDDQIKAVKELAAGAIGLDESRGDTIAVRSVPFNREDQAIVSMREAMNSRPSVPVGANAAKGVTPAVAVAVVVMLFIVGLVYMLRQNSVQTDKSKLILSGSSSAATSSDISDLVSDKIGRSTLPGDTKINTSEQLEQLAKEKPTKVAELLKSTWLADKER